MGLDFATAFKKPFMDIKKLVIGILLSILPVVNFFALGYQLDVAKNEMKKNKKLPEWNNWGKLFINGFLAVLIGVIYFIPVIILSVLFGVSLYTGGMMALGPGSVVLVLLGIATAYVAPSALLHFIKNEKFGEAFAFSSVFKKAFTKDYFVAWIVGSLYLVVASVILGYVKYIGPAIANFVAGLTMMSLLGEVFSKK